MRSKTRRSATMPSPRGPSRPNQVLIAVVLVVIGATIALGFDRLIPPASSRTTASPSAPPATDSAVASASDEPLPSDIPSDAPSDSPSPSPSPVAPILAAAMPHTINGVTLTVESDLGSTILGNDPGSRSFAAAVTTLGVTPAKLELAFAYDEAGSLAVTVLGFRIPGISPAKLRPLVVETWLSATAPGVKSTSITIGGIPTTKVTYGDEGSDEYVLVRGDAVFVVETSNPDLAAAAVQAMAAIPAPSGSPAAS
jgi:hypothetical protein